MEKNKYCVNIKFSIDIETLDACIRYMLKFRPELKITKGNVIKTIKKQVYGYGINVINFPEYWGDEVCIIGDNEEEVQKWIEKMRIKLGIEI